MRTKERRERTAVYEETTSIKCDRCGKEMTFDKYHGEGASFEMSFGYGSRFDLDTWRFDTCDDCAEWLRSEFKTAEVEHG